MTPELKAALDKLASMKAPSVERILRVRGYNYEADVIEELIRIWERNRTPDCA